MRKTMYVVGVPQMGLYNELLSIIGGFLFSILWITLDNSTEVNYDKDLPYDFDCIDINDMYTI